MSGPSSEYMLADCSKERKDIKTGEVLKVTYDNYGKCDRSESCLLTCQHKKK